MTIGCPPFLSALRLTRNLFSIASIRRVVRITLLLVLVSAVTESLHGGIITVNVSFDDYIGGPATHNTNQLLVSNKSGDPTGSIALEFKMPDQLVGETIVSAFLELNYRGSEGVGAPSAITTLWATARSVPATTFPLAV